jgi:hypothetical protein
VFVAFIIIIIIFFWLPISGEIGAARRARVPARRGGAASPGHPGEAAI